MAARQSGSARRLGRVGRRWQGRERPLASVPMGLRILLLTILTLQIGFSAIKDAARPTAERLPSAPSADWLRIASLDDPLLVSRLAMLWLQAFDNQPGVRLPLKALDYARGEAWLALGLDLDPRSEYPLLVATRIYAMVQDEQRVRRMLEFAYRRFHEAPDTRWRWLAHASLMAKHRLRDLPLALRYARAITDHATGDTVPYWARDLSVILLAEMGELEAARGLIGALLESGTIRDGNELRFLERKLEEIEAMASEVSKTRQ